MICQTDNTSYCGWIEPDGKVSLLNSTDGKPLTTLMIDQPYLEQHLMIENGKIGIVTPRLLMDDNQVYLVLPPPGNNRAYSNRISFMQVVPVDGVVYAFDRVTGKRLWFNEDLFDEQLLVIERFNKLPVLVAANSGIVPEKKDTKFKVVIIDKRTGKLRYNNVFVRTAVFLSMLTDVTNNGIVLWGYGVKISIDPKDDAITQR